MVKKIGIGIFVAIVIFCAGYFAGRWQGDNQGTDDSKVVKDINGITDGIGQASDSIGDASEGIKDAQGSVDISIGIADESKHGLDRCRELARELNEGLRGLQASESAGIESGAE